MPFSVVDGYAEVYLGMKYLGASSSIGLYGILYAGWSSNSKYTVAACLRTVAQMLSYEIATALLVLPIIVCTGSLSLDVVVESQRNILFLEMFTPLFLIFVISALIETNRAPFDLPEAESELVAGYNTEYSGLLFAMFFLGEYSNILLVATYTAILFVGGYLPLINIGQQFPFMSNI